MDNLPCEVVVNILAYLSSDELFRIKAVCRRWNCILSCGRFWMHKFGHTSKSAYLLTSIFNDDSRGLSRLYHLLDSGSSKSLIENNNFSDGVKYWDLIVGPYKVSSNSTGVHTRNKRFVRCQRLKCEAIPMIDKLLDKFNVELIWCVWVTGTPGYACTYSARVVDRNNIIVQTLCCLQPTHGWRRLVSRVSLKEGVDLGRLYYKEQGYCLSCSNPEFNGVKILNPKIYLEIKMK